MRFPQRVAYRFFNANKQLFTEAETEFVVVYKPWDADGTVTRIVRQHRTMNGTPNRLTIHLYHSKCALNHGQAYYTKIFEYQEDEIIGPPPAW